MMLQELNNIPTNCFKFAVCRNPYTRAFSHYKHFNRVNNLGVTFVDFLKIVHSKKHFPKTPMICYDQSYYVLGLNSQKLDKIYRFEKLEEFESDFEVKLDKLNSNHYDETEYVDTYRYDSSIEMVKYIYMRDFHNFNYSLDFESSLRR